MKNAAAVAATPRPGRVGAGTTAEGAASLEAVVTAEGVDMIEAQSLRIWPANSVSQKGESRAPGRRALRYLKAGPRTDSVQGLRTVDGDLDQAAAMIAVLER